MGPEEFYIEDLKAGNITDFDNPIRIDSFQGSHVQEVGPFRQLALDRVIGVAYILHLIVHLLRTTARGIISEYHLDFTRRVMMTNILALATWQWLVMGIGIALIVVAIVMKKTKG